MPKTEVAKWVRRSLFVGFLVPVIFGAPFLAEGAEKTFVYGLEGEPESLDFAKAVSVRTDRITWLLCDALVNTSKDGQSIEPGLAESWSTSPDGRSVVMTIRAGVSFHDGTPLDAAAVKTSFERQFRSAHELYTSDPPNTKEAMLNGLIDEIKIQDRLTISFRLKYPGIHYLSDVDIVSPTALARSGKSFGRAPVCTGPYKFESWSSDRIVLTANDRFWGGRPRIDRVIFRFIPDGKSLAEALVNGDLDFLPAIPDPQFLERIRGSSNAKILSVPGLNVYYLGFNTERPPFGDLNLRKAVVQGINGPRMTAFLGRGIGVAAKGPLPPAVKGYDPAVSQATYDPQAARDLLAQNERKFERPIRLVYNNSQLLMAELAGAIQSDLRRIGITVELMGKTNFKDAVEAMRTRQGDMFIYSWHIRGPYPERLLTPLFHSRSAGTSNLTHYTNPIVDGLLDEAIRLPDGPEQRRIYSRIQKMIVADAPMAFLYHATRMAAISNRVEGLSLKLDVAPYDKLVRVDVSQ